MSPEPMAREEKRRLPLEAALGRFQSIADALWVKLARLREKTGRACAVFTAAEPGAGTTVITATTAIALTRMLRVPVRVIEANVERPGLAAYLEVAGAPGLSDLLEGHCTVEDCWQDVHAIKGLSIVSAGKPRRSIPGELAGGAGRKALDELFGKSEFTLVDAPPLLGHPYARPLLARTDGVVLVLRARATRLDAAEATVKMLEESGTTLLGSVLNRFKSDMPFGIGER